MRGGTNAKTGRGFMKLSTTWYYYCIAVEYNSTLGAKCTRFTVRLLDAPRWSSGKGAVTTDRLLACLAALLRNKLPSYV